MKFSIPFKRQLSPSSLRSQLLTRTLMILAFILLAIGIMQCWAMKNFLYQNEAETLNAKLMSLPKDADFPAETGIPKEKGTHSHAPDRKFFFLPDISLSLIDKYGHFKDLLGSKSIAAPELSKSDYSIMRKKHEDHLKNQYKIARNKQGVEQLIVTIPVGGKPGDFRNLNDKSLLQMGISTAPLQHVLLQQLLIFIILSALALAAGLAVYSRTLRKTLVPLSKVVNAVKKTNAVNLAERLPVHQGGGNRPLIRILQ